MNRKKRALPLNDLVGVRVAVVSLNFHPEPTGISVYATDMARLFSEAGARVEVVTGVPHYPAWNRTAGYPRWRRSVENFGSGIAVTRLPHYVPTRPTLVRRLVMEATFATRVFLHPYRDVQLVVCTSPSLIATAAVAIRGKLSRKFVTAAWVQDIYAKGADETYGAHGWLIGLIRSFERCTLANTDLLGVIHERFIGIVGEMTGRRDICLLQNWSHTAVDDSSFSQNDLYTLLPEWPRTKSVVLHSGNMGMKQGLETIVDAAKMADVDSSNNIHFVLMGDGSMRSALKERSQGVHSITFIGTQPKEIYLAALKAADVLLVNEKPGVAEMALPSKLTSYFSSSTPVVASVDPDGVCASEVERSGGGVVVPSGRPYELLSEILNLLQDPGRCAQLGNRGREYSESRLGRNGASQNIRKWVTQIEQLPSPA